MTGKLVLVRHGETEGNVAKILDTKLPGLPLTERGVAQAKAFGARLPVRPSMLLHSHALRAAQTAAYIEATTGVPAVSCEDVYEVQVGDLDGATATAAHEQFQDIYLRWHEGYLTERVPGGETGEDLLNRFLPQVERLRAEYLDGAPSGDVLLVTHGAAMRLVGKVLGNVQPPFTTNNHLDNTETIELVPLPGGGWECVRWGRFTQPFGTKAEPGADDPMG